MTKILFATAVFRLRTKCHDMTCYSRPTWAAVSMCN